MVCNRKKRNSSLNLISQSLGLTAIIAADDNAGLVQAIEQEHHLIKFPKTSPTDGFDLEGKINLD